MDDGRGAAADVTSLPGMQSALSRATLRTARFVAARRRLLAAGFTAAAVAGGLHAVSPQPAATRQVVVASVDLPPGTALTSDQVKSTPMPEGLVPRGSLDDVDAVTGRLLAAPVRSGEPLTDVRLLGAALVDGYGDGRVAAPVRLADAGAAALLRTGDRVDVLAADPQGTAKTAVVAPNARVIVVPEPEDGPTQSASSSLVVLAVTPDIAKKLSQAAVVGPLSVSIRG